MRSGSVAALPFPLTFSLTTCPLTPYRSGKKTHKFLLRSHVPQSRLCFEPPPSRTPTRSAQGACTTLHWTTTCHLTKAHVRMSLRCWNVASLSPPQVPPLV
ncbi:hypothetical protein VTK73DRAFT_1113 [Phialemonium thermophilum]|uniref:Secreted protein n=1 Tax=Phialemonium thermophilum TaxID=223376 RepID=A0ABR3XAX5_9PEZI